MRLTPFLPSRQSHCKGRRRWCLPPAPAAPLTHHRPGPLAMPTPDTTWHKHKRSPQDWATTATAAGHPLQSIAAVAAVVAAAAWLPLRHPEAIGAGWGLGGAQRAQSGFRHAVGAPELARARPSLRGTPFGCCWCRRGLPVLLHLAPSLRGPGDGSRRGDSMKEWLDPRRHMRWRSRNCGFLSGLKALTLAAVLTLLSLLLCALLSTLSSSPNSNAHAIHTAYILPNA
jgi:hypothetical protein